MPSMYRDIPSYGDRHWQAPVQTALDLPAAGNDIGDFRFVLTTLALYYWSGTAWVLFSSGGGAEGQDLNGL